MSRSQLPDRENQAPADDTDSASLVATPGVTDDAIEGAFTEIRDLQRQSTVDFMIRVGRIIVERFYAGNLALWHDRGTKDVSFRKLEERFAADGDVGVSASSLQRSVSFYDLEQRVGVSGRKHLMRSHIGAVVGLPEDVQRRLLDQAEAQGMTSDALKVVAKAARKATGETRGRPTLPAFVKTVNALGKVLDGEENAFADLDAFQTLAMGERVRLLRNISRMRAECERLEREFSPHVHDAGNASDEE